MIGSIALKNFMGLNLNVKLTPGVNTLTGRNGAGKSRLLDAICFAFARMDAVGNKTFTHLMTAGEETTKVIVDEKWAVTVKGPKKYDFEPVAGNCRLEIPHCALNNPELVLASMVPGYLMSLPPDKQPSVLASVIPVVDRITLIQQLSGLTLDELKATYQNIDSKKSLKTMLAEVRAIKRNVSDAIVSAKAKIEMLEVKLYKQLTPYQDQHQLKAKYIEMEGQWRKHVRSDEVKKMIEEAVKRNEKYTENNKLLEKRKEELKASMGLFEVVPVPDYDEGMFLKIDEEIAKRLPEPTMPKLEKSLEGEYCPTCGQAISPRRSSVISQSNEDLMAKYTEELTRVRKHNMEVDARIKDLNSRHTELKKNILAAQKTNDYVARRRNEIQKEIDLIQPFQITVVPEAKEVIDPPTKEWMEEYERVKMDYHTNEWNREEYNREVREKGEAEQLCLFLQRTLKENQLLVDRLKAVEKAMKECPQAELEVIRKPFELGDDIKVVIGDDGLNFLLNNIPYNMLSVGQKLKVGIRFCCKLHDLMNSSRIICIDNGDLLDNDLVLPEGFQYVIAKVGDTDLCVQS